ncbi:MAG: hypothetical protein U1E53_34675 [Dongiaceae bacterium]
MGRFLGIFLAVFLCGTGTVHAFDDWSIFESRNGRVWLAACAGAVDGSVVVVDMPAYAIGGESLESWFGKQIRARILAWSGQYPTANLRIGASTGKYLIAEATFSADGRAWHADFFAKAGQGRAQWSAVLGSLAAARIDGHYAEAKQALYGFYATGDMRPPAAAQPQAAPSFTGTTAVGVLKSSSAKWLLNGSLTDRDRRYVLFDSGGAVEIAPPAADPIATGTWATAQGDYQIIWADGSVEAISGACFSAVPQGAASAAKPPGTAPAASGGSAGAGQHCHTEIQLRTTSTMHLECFPPPCRQVFGPVTARQEVEVCN